jgi:hypothetical protein
MHPRLCEEIRFSLQFDDALIVTNTVRPELSWGEDPMDALMLKQELEREELMAYLAEHMH